MSAVDSLVPARFLTIISHFVIVVTIFWSRVSSRFIPPLSDKEHLKKQLRVCLLLVAGKQREVVFAFGIHTRAI